MDIITTLFLVLALITSFYYWKKYKEKDVFWLMILSLVSLGLKWWRITESRYLELPELVADMFLILRTVLSIIVVFMVIKGLFFKRKDDNNKVD